LITASFLIFFAQVANFKVEIVSENASGAGEIITIIVVLQFPPNESLSNLVNLESQYGM